GIASNIYLNGASKLINISSKVQPGRPYGVSSPANGAVTQGWPTYNKNVSPLDYFVSETSVYEVGESTTGELMFVSNYIDENWSTAVAASLESGKVRTVTLKADWVPDSDNFGTGTGYYGGMLYVPVGAKIILDMNGFSINRGISAASTTGGIFRINGQLTIINNTGNDSIITGGHNTASTYSKAGGITVLSSGKIDISNVKISGNTETSTGKCASALYVEKGGVCNLENVTITNNVGSNQAAVCLDDGARFTIAGKMVIDNNTTNDGASRDVTFYFSDAKATNTNTTKITINSALASGSHIGVYKRINNYATSDKHDLITENYGRYNSESADTYFFASDSPNHKIVGKSGQVALFCLENATNWVNAVKATSSSSRPVTFTLYSNWIAENGSFGNGTGYYYNALRVPSDKNIIIDLNSFKIDRNLSSGQSNGYVVYAEGKLTVEDSVGGGMITGGYNTTANSASGIYVKSSTTTLLSGAITGNEGGYGVYVHKSGALSLGGSAQVIGNTNGADNADIYIANTIANVTIVSQFTDDAKFGISRESNGVFTEKYGIYNSELPSKYFTSQDSRFYVTDNGLTGSKYEGAFLSSDPAINWQFAVKQSIDTNGKQQTFRLLSDWYADNNGSFGTGTGYRTGGLYVPSTASIILDLNGHKIDKKGIDVSSCILFVDGKLEIIDSSGDDSGKITGGAHSVSSSGVDSRSGGMTIRNGSVIMRGGTITGNTATYGPNKAGAVYIHNDGTFTMLGGKITGNSGYQYGGVYVSRDGKINLGGSAQIYGNPSLDAYGNPTGHDSDLYFYNTAGKATITEPFTEDATIGILADVKKLEASGTIITKNFGTKNKGVDPTTVFFSDEDTEYRIGLNKSEAVIYSLNNSINWTNAVTASLDTGKEVTFVLYSNWTAEDNANYYKSFGDKKGYRYGALRVPSGAKIILDLNGHTIDREMPTPTSYGYILFVEGKLTIIDSTVSESDPIVQGSITGGQCIDNGRRTAGCIFVENGGTLTILNGTITGNVGGLTAADPYAYSGGVTVAADGKFNLGGTAQIYGNTNLSGESSNIYLCGNDQVITITEPMRLADGDAGKFGVMRGTVKNGKAQGIGSVTSGWGKYVPGVDPADHFFPDSDYILVTSEGVGNNCEAVILSNDNHDNWVYAVTTSLKNNTITRFTLVRDWVAPDKNTKYYNTLFGNVAKCFQDGALFVPKGASIVMDLKGFSIDRNHDTNLDGGNEPFNYVINVEGCLQIVDSSTGKTGTITGGSYGIYVAEDGFVCMGELPEDVKYMNGSGSQYVIREANYGSGSITGNSVFGVYVEGGTFAMTGGKITGNTRTGIISSYVEKGETVYKRSKIMLGGSAYIYTDNKKTDLTFRLLDEEIEIISAFTPGAKIGFRRDALGLLTKGWGEKNGDSTSPIPYFISKGSDKYTVETALGDDGHIEVFLTSYDNQLNWQYAVSQSLKTHKQQTFTMYECWIAERNSTYVTSFGSTSAFKDGALYVPSGANILMNLNGHMLSRNLSKGTTSGYSIYVSGKLEIYDAQIPNPENVTFEDCYRDGGLITGGNNTSGSSAGAIHIASGTVTLNDVTISGNKATSKSASAGAIYVGGTLNFVSGTITNNDGYSAGAVYIAGGTFNMPASDDGKTATISENYAQGAGGGAVYAAGYFNMESGTITGNSGMIGAVYVGNNGKFTLSGSATITGNTGSSAGGVFVYNSSTTYFNIDGGYIINNQAISAGGIYSAGKITMTGGEISGNVATGSTNTNEDFGGGGIYLANSANVTITGGKITQNTGLNGVRVYSSGTLNLGGSAWIKDNISTDAGVIESEGEGATCDVFLTAETRKINIVSQFTADAQIGIYRDRAGVITRNYGKYNEAHPKTYFFSNKSIYAVAVTDPGEDEYAEAVIGTPIDGPAAYQVEGKDPVYNGDWQTIIVGYDTDKMLVEKLPEGVRGTKTDADGNIEIEAVNAGTYIIAFVLGDQYCWKDGSTGPLQIVAKIMPYAIAIVWEDETHDGEMCKYDGTTVHAPKAKVDADALFTNVLTGEKDECAVDISGATVNASGDGMHTATAVMLDNPNYTVGENNTHEFKVLRADLPNFQVKTTQAYFKTNCTLQASGNLENGTLHYYLPENPDNVTLDENTGVLYSAEKDLSKKIKVKIVVDATNNYNSAEAIGEIEVLPGKVDTEIEQTEVIYGETIQLTLRDYDADEMGAITYIINNIGGIGSINANGVLSTAYVGEIEVVATIAANGPYAETEVSRTITILQRVINVSWDELTATYDGNEHKPVVSISSENGDKEGVIAKDSGNVTLSVVSKGTTTEAAYTNAGKYDISVVISNPNYMLASEDAYNNVYEIYKADLADLSFDDLTAYYDTAFTPKVNGNKGNGEVTFTVADDDADRIIIADKVLTPKDTGNIDITASIAETANYNAGSVTGTFDVKPIDMPLALTSLTTVYGTDLTLTAEGYEAESTVTYKVADGYEAYAEINNGVLTPKKVGTVKVLMSATASKHYNAAVDVEGEVTITKREVEIEWSDLTFTYDKTAKLPTATVKAADLVNGDTCTVNTITVQGFATAIDADTYTAVASVLSNENYTPNATSLNKEFVINPAQASIEWETGKTYTYNGTAQAPKANVTNLYGDDKCDVIVLGTKNAANGLTAMATGLSNPNYVLDGENLTTTYDILPAPITVSWSNTTLVYTGSPQLPTATAVGLFADDTCEIIVIGAQTNFGEYTATAIGTKNPNYVLAEGEHTTLFNITKGEITVSLSNEDAIYGTTYTLNVTGVPTGATVEYTLGAGSENVILSGNSLIPLNIGTVTVTVKVGETENYDETTDTKVINILPCPVKISWDNLTFEYDKTQHVPTATVSNLVNSDSCVVTVTGKQTDAGTYTATVTAITNNKYTLTDGTDISHPFTITPRQVTVEWGEDTEFTYNGTEQHPSITIGNLLEGDTCTAIVNGATNAAVGHTATLVGISNSNYTIEDVDNKTVNFDIYQLVAILQWSDTTFVYDGTEQGPTAVVTNLCTGDECTVTVAGKEIDVGDYIATAIALSNINYKLSDDENKVTTSFKITKADRTFALASDHTVYGTDLPITFIGVEDDEGITYSLTAGTGNATMIGDDLHPTKAGIVHLTITAAETDNYKPCTKTFDITIDKYAVEIEWEYDVYLYDGTEHKPVATVSNVLDGETCTVDNVTGAIHAGDRTATVTAISNTNYTLEGGKNVSTTFTIRPKPVTIEWDENKTFTYDGTPKGPGAHLVVEDLIAGDTCGITVSGKQTDAGSYTASITALTNSDYTLDGATGLTADFVIERAQPTITILTKNATLGIDCEIQISGNICDGVVRFEIDDGNELAYISGTKLISQKIGTVTVHAYVGETNNTYEAEATGEIEIAKGKAPLTMDRTTVTYGNTLTLVVDDNDGFLRDDAGNLIFGDVTFKVAPGEDDRAVIETGNILRPLKAGIVHVIMSVEESDNYVATDVTVEITVNKRIVVLEWTEESFVYNKTEQKPTATVTNLVYEDSCTVTVQGATNAGTWTAQAIGLSNDNYTLVGAKETTKEFTISPKPVDINWGELTLEFNGKKQFPKAWVNTIDNESCTVILAGGGTDAGTYEATATGLSNENYVLTDDNLTVEFEITRAHIKPVLSPTTAVYNEEVTLSLTGNLEDGEVTYKVITTDESTGNATITGNRFLPTKAGKVVVQINIAETTNCYAYEGTAIITVEKAERGTITLINTSTVYGQKLKLEVNGNEDDPGSVIYTVANVPGGLPEGFVNPNPHVDPSDPRAVIIGDELITRHAGQVYVTVKVGETDNYKEATKVILVSIAQRVAEITWTNTEFDYNGSVQTPTAAVSNLLDGDTCDVTVIGGKTNAGTYNASVDKISNPDYTYYGSVTANTVFTIGKVEITIELLTTHITIGKVESLSISGNKGNGTVTYVVTEGTGNATIVDASGDATENGHFIKGTRLGSIIVKATVAETTNYLAAEVSALVIIEKDRPTITLVNNTVMYGEQLTLEVNGNVENGFVSYTVSNGTGKATYSNGILTATHVGIVNVTVTVGETTNYGSSTTTHEVKITPRPITGIEWSDFEFTYD
ncbi:MAG: hypothetical protein K2K80_00170, partial [Clostridia bacterium]|nr:hypothetical protein [Clostridia bacterium]